MDFISNKESAIREMLAAIGLEKIEDLFEGIPRSLRMDPPAAGDGLSEFEGLCLMERLARRNAFPDFTHYLGAGAYDHYVPALTGAICAKSEFLTSYTPYQAEASQGMLQAIFEFQSGICALTGLDVANASVYDGASACAEAILMTLDPSKNRNKILIAGSVHPRYRAVVDQYTRARSLEIVKIPFDSGGKLDPAFVRNHADDRTAGILIQSPNFFGAVENAGEIANIAREKGALSILCADLLSYGIYASAGESGIDIAVGDCQSIGLPLQFGGPYAGYMACRQQFVRRLPGRIVGETVDAQGRRGFVLTLQTREQHIRREKASSNICTNQALAALACLTTMLWYGKNGIKESALQNYQKASYLREQLSRIPGIGVDLTAPIFNEFPVDFGRPVEEVLSYFRKHLIEPGYPLKEDYPEFSRSLLVCVTEKKSIEELDRFAILTHLFAKGPPDG